MLGFEFSNLPATNPNAWTQQNLGEVFGVTIDTQSPPNIYVTATEVYGSQSAEGPVFVQGKGGPGGVYRLDATSGAITYIRLRNSGPALGNICHYRSGNGINWLYVSNFDDGLIYKINAESIITPISATVPPAVISPLGITFDHGATHGVLPSPTEGIDGLRTQLGRRIWGVKVFKDRLYYSVWRTDPANRNSNKNQIWSIALNPSTGDFIPGNEVNEIAAGLPNFPGSAPAYSQPVATIEFTEAGNMLLAERYTRWNWVAYNGTGETNPPHHCRVLEYTGSQGAWVPSFETKFRVGSYTPYGNYTNAAGGVASDCDGTLWATGDALLPLAGNPRIYGLQQIAANGNNTPTDTTPTTNSILIDLDGQTDTFNDKTQIGAVAMLRTCAACPVAGNIECPRMAGGPFYYDFTVTNNSGVPATSMILAPISGLTSIDPPTRIFSPAFASGTSKSFNDFKLIGAQPGQQVCFEMILLNAQNQPCCSQKVCITLPACTCLEVLSQVVTYSLGGKATLTLTVKNLEPYPLYYAYIIVANNKKATPSSKLFTAPGIPTYGTFTFQTDIANVAINEVVPFTLSIHAADFTTCCSRDFTFSFGIRQDPTTTTIVPPVLSVDSSGIGNGWFTIRNESSASRTYSWAISGLEPTFSCPGVLTAANFTSPSPRTVSVPRNGSVTVPLTVNVGALGAPGALAANTCANWGVEVTNADGDLSGALGMVQRSPIAVGLPILVSGPVSLPYGSTLSLPFTFRNSSAATLNVPYSLSSELGIFGFSPGVAPPVASLDGSVTVPPGAQVARTVQISLLTSDSILIAAAFQQPIRITMQVDLDGDGLKESTLEFLVQLALPGVPVSAELLQFSCITTPAQTVRMRLDCQLSPGVVTNVQRSFDLQTWEFVPFSLQPDGPLTRAEVVGDGGVCSLFLETPAPAAFFRVFSDLRNSPPPP